ncbi:glycosyl transferase family 2 protein [Arthrobacter crystallopoietes BAB-32]|uniref:Glycosyl transferase family 2 protein n=1 Tax=Arthrobacter crystallopoietes BAB-32 TaxID=1246476 RepID=N1VBJ2_9MICC|nr:glycosyltransferase [Arthrobacter crystallopoietes]EMY35668.1 glycosyl transferase family 2 protein [Arthrobacter crystallopoietes BAB-32]
MAESAPGPTGGDALPALEAEVVIAVHTMDRPIRRAVESVLAAGQGRAGALVVCHNTDPAPVRTALDGLIGRGVRVLDLVDGIASPAGPFNYGLRAATTDFVGIMGSDDTLESGALAAWLDVAATAEADVVIAPLRTRSGQQILTPRARVWRGVLVDPIRDRLAYRTAPLGLIRRSLLQERSLALTEGLRTGEDLEFGLRLWFSGARIAYLSDAPAYLVGEDAAVRVTSAVLPLKEQFRDLRLLTEGTWFAGLGAAQREAIAVKLLRGHVISAALRRGSGFDWEASDCQEMADVLTGIAQLAPGAARLLSGPDEQLLLSLATDASPEAVRTALRRREAAHVLERSLTRRMRDNLRVESPLRSNLNSVLATINRKLRRKPAQPVRQTDAPGRKDDK